MSLGASGHVYRSVYNKRRTQSRMLRKKSGELSVGEELARKERSKSLPFATTLLGSRNQDTRISCHSNRRESVLSQTMRLRRNYVWVQPIPTVTKNLLIRRSTIASMVTSSTDTVSAATSGRSSRDHVPPSRSGDSTASSSDTRGDRRKKKKRKRRDEKGGGGSLLRAARSGNVEKLTTLLDQESIDISTSNSSGLTALHLAAKEGHCSIINELLQRGAPINQTTKRGNTALHIASLAGKLAVVELLLAKGADANSQAQNAFTPLYMAAQEGHEVIVEYLLNHGANQSISTEDGFTPLAVALQENKDKVVQLLLDNDVKGRVKLPALHIAARKDDVKAAVLLLQSDNTADTTSRMMVNRTTESGFTALHIAAHYGNVNVATLLLNRGASVDFKARNGITPMHVAAKRGNTRFCALLLDRNGRPDACTRDGLIPIHCAARSGHLPIVKLFLDCENTPKYAKTKNGLTPLHMAAQGGHADVIEILLDKEYPVDDITSDYLSALHIASHCGHVSVAELMLSHNANVDCKALNGFTPLHVACKKNRIKIVELLISYKANIEAVTESGLTPLHIACFMGHDEIVELLITRKAKLNTVNVRGETALHMATRSGKTEIVTFLLRHGAKPDTRKQESQTCLHLAARLNKHEILKLLIKNGATVDATMEDGYTPLHVAAKEGHVDICETLLDKKASVAMTTKKGFTPLHLAAKYGRLEVANLLIRNDAEPDAGGKNGLTPLHVAAHFDNQQVALLLLKNGASPHASGKNGYTPLHIAAKKNQMEIAITLLEYGASPNSKTRMDVTPLHLAAQEGHTDMCSLLLAKDANVNAAAKHGLSPMHLAAQEDRVSVAKVLYDNKSLVDPLTKSGCTPLHVASHHGNINVANYLLSLDAKVNAKTKNGYTPLHQASQQGHTHVVNLLIKYGASPNELTNSGNTALSLAKRLGYISVVDTLKTITTETTTTVTEEKRKYNIPETVNEGFMSDASDDEGDETMVGGGFLTNNEMKELGDDSIVPTEAALFAVNQDSKYATLEASGFTGRKMSWSSSATNESDNIKSPRSPRCNGFLVSFMVDARGGTVRGTRHYDLRIVVPPQACRAPTRVTCRFARRRHAAALNPPSNPSLYDAEGNATRVLEIGPRGNTFLEPVAIEVPHFANVKNNYRQVVVMRSNDGINWKDHKWPCTDEQFCKQHGNEELQPADKLAERRIFRIIASDFPRYFALVSRPLENAKSIGEAGGELTSSVVKEARAKFPEGSLTKTINVAMQVIPITPEICKRAVGNKAKASAILTIEPRRRKFHKSIILTVPLPEGTDKKDYLSSVEDSTLRLLCSISGEDKPAQWEDITGSTNFNFLDNFVTFTSTVSARFWLIDCRQPSESSALAHQIYAEATRVPYMAKFLVYAKSHDPLEGRLRVFCLTEDRYEKTLEKQENYVEIARSKDVEVTEGSRICVECSGNLSAPIKSGQVHKFQFQAFNDNRIQLLAKVRDSIQEPCGRLTFTRLPLGPPKSHGPRKTLCNLNVRLPPCDRESDSDEDYSMPDEKSVSQTPEEEASEARKRYFLVDPASVDASARDESSPEEIAKDMVDVIQKLNQVQVILQPQADAREDKKEEFDEEDADVGVEETAQVVTEVRNRLVEMKQLLESEEIRSDSYLEFESPKVEEKPTSVMGEHLDRTSRIFERNVEPPAAPERSSLSELHGRDFRGSATVKEISDNFDVLAQRIDADMHGSASEHDDFSVKFEEKVETAEGTVTVASTDVTPCLESTHSASPESLTQSSDTFIDHNQENEGDLIDFLNYDLNTASSQTPAKESATSDLTSTVAETIVVDERTHTSIEQTIRDINSNEELCQLLADDLTSQNDVTQPNDVTLNNEHVQGSSQRFDDSQLEDKAHSDVTSINDVTTFTDVTAVPSVQVRGESPLVEDRVLPVVHQVESVYNEEQRCFAGLGVFQMRRSQSATSDQMKMVRFHEDVTVINADRTRVVRSISKEHVSSSSEDESEMSDTESASFSPKNSDSEDSAILDEEEEEKPKTLQQRISAYQAASDELHRELERFRRNTPRYGDQRAALPNNRRHSDPHTTTESASTSTAALTSVVSSPAVNNVDDGSESEDEISPVILEESHTVKELLKTWEQKPVMKPVTFRRTPSTEEHKVFSKTPETSDGSQVLSRFPEVEIEIAQPSTISELSESDSCQLSLDEGLGDWNREIVMISESAQKEQCVEEQQSDDDKDVKSPVSDVETDGKSVDSLLSDLESLQSKQYEASIKDETSCNKYSVVQTTVQTNDLEKTEDIGIANISFTRRELVQHTEEVTKSELEIIKAEHHRAENPSLEPEQNKDEEVVFNDQASDQQTASIEGSFDATDIQEPETGHPESLIKMEQSSDLQAYQPLGTNEVTSTTDLTQYKEVDDDLLLTETHVPQSSQFTSIVQEHLTEYESSQQVQDDQTIKVEVVHDKERLSDLQPRTNFQTTEVDEGQLLVDAEETLSSTQEPVSTVETISYSKDTMSPSESGQLNQNVCKDDTNLDKVDTTIVTTDLPIETVSVKMEETSQHEDERDHINVDHTVAIAEEYCDDMTVQTKIETHLNDSSTCIATAAEDHVATNDDKVESCLAESNVTQTPAVGIADELSFSREYVKTVDDLPVAEIDFNTTFDETARTQEKRDNIQDTEERTTDPVIYLTETKVDKEESLLDQTAPLDTERYAVGGSKLLSTDADEIAEVSFTNEAVAKTAEDIPCLAEPSQSTDHQRATVCAAAEISHVDDVLPESVPQETEVDFDSVSNETVQSQDEGVDFEGKEKQTIDPEIYLTETKVDKLESSPVQTKTNIYTCLDETARSQDERGDIECAEEKTTDLEMSTTIALDKQRSIQYQINDTSIETDFCKMEDVRNEQTDISWSEDLSHLDIHQETDIDETVGSEKKFDESEKLLKESHPLAENTIVLEEQVEVLESSSIVDTRAKQETTEAFDITEGSVDVEFSQTDVNQSDMTSAVQQKNLVSDEEPFLKDSTDTKRANESEQMSVSDPDTVKNDTTILILKEEQQTATTVVSNQAKSSSDFSTTTSDKVIAQSTIDDESVCSVSQYSLSDDVTSYPTPDVMVIVSSCTEDRLDEISRGEYQAYEQPEPEAVIGGKKEVCQEIEKCEDDDQEVHETEKDIVIDEHVYQQENIKEMIGEDYGQIQGPAVLPSDKKHREEGETTRYKDNVATSSQDTDETGTNDKELDGFDEIAMKSVANQQQSNEVNETESAHQVEEQSTILREGVYGQHHVDAITDFTADEQEIDDVSLTFVQSGVVSHRDVDFDSPVQETEETTRGKNFGVEKAVTDESDEKTVTTSASSMPVVTQDTHVEETAVADANTKNVDLDHQPQDGGSKTEADITVQETVVTPELQPTLESQCAEMKKEDYQPEVSVTSTEVHDSYTAVDSTSHVQEASCSDYESKSATTDQMQDDRDGVEINAYSHEEFATSEPFNEVKEIRLSFETVTDLVQQGILEDLSANDNSSLPEVSHFELDRNITTADQLTEGTGDAEDVFGHIKSAASEQKVVEETKREENGSPGDQQYSHQSDVKIPEEVTEDVNSLKETSCSDAQVQEHVSENEGLHISTDNDQISLEQSDVTIVKEVHEVSTYESDLSPEKTTLQEEKIDDLSNELMDTRTENKEDLVTYEVEETCAAHEPEHKTSYLLQTTITDTGLDIIQTGSEDATVGYAVHSVTQLTLDEEQLLSDENRVDLVAVKVERPDEEHEINQATSYHFKEFENADVLAFDQQIPEHKYIEVKSQDISNEDDQTDSSEVGHPIMPAHQAEEGSLVSMETDHVKHQDDIIVDDVTGSYVDDVTRTFVHSDVARHSEVEFDSPVHQSDEVICATKIVDVETVTDGTREDGFATDDHEPEIEGLTQFEEALMPDTEVDHVTANYHFQDELCDVGADMAGQKVATVEPTPLTYQDHDTVDNFDEVTNTQTDDRLRDGDLESLVQSTAVEQISCSGTRIKDDIKFSDTINPLKESSPSDNERVLLSNKIVEHPKDHDDHVMRTTDENECESETEADAVPFNTEEEESFQSEKWEDHVSTEREETYFAEKTTTQEEFVHKEPSAPVYNVDQSSQVTVDGRNEEFESVIEVDGKAETLLTAETSRSDLEGFVTEISHQPRQICRSTQEAFLSDYSSAELSNQTSAQQLQESNIIKETRSECLQQEQTTPEPRDSDSVYHHELFYTDNGEKLEIESNKGMSEKVATELPEQSHIDDVLERDVDTDTHCAKRRESVKHGLASLRQTQISFDSIAHQQTVDNSLKRLSSVSSSSCLESEEGDVDLRRDSQMDDIEEHPLLLTDEESQEDIHDEGHTEELEQTSALSKSEESYMQRIGDDLKLSDSKADECGFGKSETHETHTKDSIEQDKFLETAAHDLVTAQISLSQLSSAEQFSEQELFASTEAPFALTDEFIVKTPNNSPEDKKDGDEDLNNKNSTQECLFEAHNIDNPALRGFETSNLMDLTAKESEQLLHKEAETEDHLWKTDGEKRLGSEDHDDPERFSSMQVNYSIQDEDQVIGTAGTPDSLAKELADAMYEEIVELEKRDLPEYDDVTGDDVKHHDDVNPSYRLAHDDYTTQHGIDLFSEIEASLGNCQTSHFARDEGLKADEASGSGSFDDFATDDVVRRSSDVIAKQGEDLLSEIEASLGAKATPCVDQNERESAKADDDVKNNAGFQEPSFCATEQSIFSEIEATLDDNKRANIAEVDIGNAGVAGETNAAGSSFNQRKEIDPFDTGELSHGNVDVTEGEFTSALIEAEMEADAIQRSMLSPSVGNMHSTSNRSSCDDFASTQGGIISFSMSHSSEFKSHENHKTIQEDLKLADTVQNDVIDASPLFESELYHVSDPSNLLTPEISVTSHGDPVMILKTDDVGCADIKQAEMMQLDDEDADHVTLDSSDEDSDKDSECSSEMGDERGFESLQCSRIVISESTEPLVLSDAVMSHVEDDVAIETVPTTAGSSLGVAAMSSSVSTQEFSSLAEERALKLHDVTSSQYEKEHVIFDTEEQFDARATCRDSNRLLRMMSVPGTQIKTVEEVYTLSDTEVDTDDHLKLNATTTKGYSDIIQERPTSPLPPREPLGSHQERRASEEQFSTLDVAHSSLRLSVEQDLSSVHVDSIGDTSAGDEFSYRNYHGGIRSFDSAATSQQFSSAEFFSSEEVYASMKGQSDAETFVQTNVVNDQEQQRDQDTDSSTLFTVKTERTYMEATTSSSKSPTANYMSMASPLATINAPGFQLREEEFLTSLPLEDVLILESHKKSDAVLEKDVIDKGSAGAKSDELMTFAEKFSRFKESIEAGGSYSAQEILVEDNHQPPGQDSDAREQQRDYIEIMDTKQARAEAMRLEDLSYMAVAYDAAAKKPLYGEEQSYSPSSNSSATCSEHTSESSDCIEMDSVDAARYRFVEEQYTDDQPLLRPETLSCDENEHILCQEEIQSDDEDFQKSHASGNRFQRQIHSTPKTSRIPVAKTSSSFVPEKKTKPAVRKSGIPTTKRTSTGSTSRLSQSLPTKGRQQKKMKQEKTRKESDKESSSIIRSTSASKLPVRRNLSITKPTVVAKQLKSEGLVSPGSTSSTVSRSSSGSSFSSFRFRKSGGSSPTQEGSIFRNEPFKSRTVSNDKYIALRQGVFTYKMSPAEEKEKRKKKREATTVGSSTDSSPLTASEEHGKMTNIPRPTRLQHPSSAPYACEETTEKQKPDSDHFLADSLGLGGAEIVREAPGAPCLVSNITYSVQGPPTNVQSTLSEVSHSTERRIHSECSAESYAQFAQTLAEVQMVERSVETVTVTHTHMTEKTQSTDDVITDDVHRDDVSDSSTMLSPGLTISSCRSVIREVEEEADIISITPDSIASPTPEDSLERMTEEREGAGFGFSDSLDDSTSRSGQHQPFPPEEDQSVTSYLPCSASSEQQLRDVTLASKSSRNVLDQKHQAVASQLGIQWPALAGALGLSPDDVWRVQKESDGSKPGEQSMNMLSMWIAKRGDENAENIDEYLSDALRKIGRDDLCPILDDPVFHYGDIDPSMHMDKDAHDSSAFRALSDELGSPFTAKGHVSSPFPFTSASKLTMQTSTPTPALKARNETLTDGDASLLVPPPSAVESELDDVDKPHFNYVIDDDEVDAAAPQVDKTSSHDSSSDSSDSDREETQATKDTEEKVEPVVQVNVDHESAQNESVNVETPQESKVKTDEESREDSEQPEPRDEDWEVLNVEPQDAEYEPEVPVTSNEVERAPSSASSTSSEDEQKEVAQKTDESKAIDVTPGSEDKPAVESDSSSSSSDDEAQSKDSSEEREITKDEDDKKKKEQVEEPKVNGDNHVDEENKPEVDYDNYDYSELEAEYGVTTTTTIVRTIVVETQEPKDFKLPPPKIEMDGEGGHVIEVSRQVKQSVVQQSASSTSSDSD